MTFQGMAIHKESWPIVMCPGCKAQPMDVMNIAALKADDRQVKLTYHCPQCRFETERVSTRPGTLPRSR